ncbi:hypothetical protein [Halorussus marinus]|uniref:hypothetical protein n=1 Tax=Halorussus marinus TaxID=2505976 RepID=UPI00106F06F6|nr:hypothetical protein [Halorussus marinus]
MTRTTVYRGTPDDHDDEPLADVYHNHDADDAVVIKAQGTEYRIPEDEPVDIYIDGEEADN